MATPPSFTAGSVLTAAQMNAVGLWRMTPTSVSGSGASITSGKGQISLNACAAVTINGVFTADFENYLLVARLSFTGGDTYIQLTASGTATAGTAYNWSMMQAYSGAGVTTTRTANTGSVTFMSNGNGVYQSATSDIFAPQLAQVTMFQTANLRNDGAYTVPANYLFYGNCNNTTQYDGIKITGGGNMTGTISIYGRTL